MALMATKKPTKPYYYAGGKRVTLEPATDLIAVDEARLAEKLPDLLTSDKDLLSGKALSGGIRLVERQALAPATLERLQNAGVTQPVFRQQGAVMVALPEVRVEDDDEARLAKVRKSAASKNVSITQDAAGRLTLRLLSADGGDAVSLAAQLIEHFKPASASPRFVRIVPRPAVRT